MNATTWVKTLERKRSVDKVGNEGLGRCCKISCEDRSNDYKASNKQWSWKIIGTMREHHTKDE